MASTLRVANFDAKATDLIQLNLLSTPTRKLALTSRLGAHYTLGAILRLINWTGTYASPLENVDATITNGIGLNVSRVIMLQKLVDTIGVQNMLRLMLVHKEVVAGVWLDAATLGVDKLDSHECVRQLYWCKVYFPKLVSAMVYMSNTGMGGNTAPTAVLITNAAKWGKISTQGANMNTRANLLGMPCDDMEKDAGVQSRTDLEADPSNDRRMRIWSIYARLFDFITLKGAGGVPRGVSAENMPTRVLLMENLCSDVRAVSEEMEQRRTNAAREFQFHPLTAALVRQVETSVEMIIPRAYLLNKLVQRGAMDLEERKRAREFIQSVGLLQAEVGAGAGTGAGTGAGAGTGVNIDTLLNIDMDTGRGITAMLIAMSTAPPFRLIVDNAEGRMEGAVDELAWSKLFATANGARAINKLNAIIEHRRNETANLLRNVLHRILTRDAIERVSFPRPPPNPVDSHIGISNRLILIKNDLVAQSNYLEDAEPLYNSLISTVDVFLRNLEFLQEYTKANATVSPPIEYIKFAVDLVGKKIPENIANTMQYIVSSNSLSMGWILSAWAQICECSTCWMRLLLNHDDPAITNDPNLMIYAITNLLTPKATVENLYDLLDEYEESAKNAARAYECRQATADNLVIQSMGTMASENTIRYIKEGTKKVTGVKLQESTAKALLSDIVTTFLKLHVYGNVAPIFVKHIILHQATILNDMSPTMTTTLNMTHVNAAALAFNLDIHLGILHPNKTVDFSTHMSSVDSLSQIQISVICNEAKVDNATTYSYVYMKQESTMQKIGRFDVPGEQGDKGSKGDGKKDEKTLNAKLTEANKKLQELEKAVKDAPAGDKPKKEKAVENHKKYIDGLKKKIEDAKKSPPAAADTTATNTTETPKHGRRHKGRGAKTTV